MPSQVLFPLIFSSVLAIYAHAQSTHSCYQHKTGAGKDISCEGVFLPPNLCKSCPLNPTNADGTFKNCRRVHDMDAPNCRQELTYYWKLNKCDWRRKVQTERWSEEDKDGLDYFVYSVCEECCDCIPARSKEWQYKEKSATHTNAKPTLYVSNRGNCHAHAFYDVCKVLPQIRFIAPEGGSSHWDWPKVCWRFQRWMQSENATNWVNNNDVQVSQILKRFTNKMNVANSCSSEEIWKSCVSLERKQGKI